ncbi:N-acetylglucosamine-6-phosphate deacetylase [Nocardia africana]|uniref:N-acetylglucosamine-6-phosphate deacetylase n=1 Tax=Nocardia africana TaxID=134964 RepID=A0A378X6Q8_9NOCA|nr:N-acetylglucosamine-6-phosphate deacetylase [Nocardia africana]MCC3317602.1 N-acetylglucosamine-6-phosphate deacetylase [Nocardia africana]SUA48361.1 N-acetylglucosamine-6-phosphate deacetylase [Nocardia africana]
MTDEQPVLRGRVVTSAGVVDDAVLEVSDGRIEAVRPLAQWTFGNRGAEPPPHRGTLLPGLVDIHNHGGFGHRFDTTDPEQARAAARYHHRQGATTVLASIVTAAPDTMVAQVAALREVAADGEIAGIHVEGPFLSAQRCGAQDPRYLLDPDPELIRRLLAAADGQLRVMTLAPERPGFRAAAQQLAEHGVVVALGHTDAGYELFREALAPNGSGTLVTHLANTMAPLHHRAPGAVAAALVSAAAGDVVVEVIGDGVHLESGFGALVFVTARHRVALVTDAMQAAGLPDGDYRLGPQAVRVEAGVARVPSGALAGGTATQLQCLRWAVYECGVDLVDAVRAAATTPAAAIGATAVGDLRPGMFADVLVVDSDLELRAVLRRGQWLR